MMILKKLAFKILYLIVENLGFYGMSRYIELVHGMNINQLRDVNRRRSPDSWGVSQSAYPQFSFPRFIEQCSKPLLVDD